LIPPTTNEPIRLVGVTAKGSSEAAIVTGGSGTDRRGIYIEGGTYDGNKEGLVSLNRTASYVSDIQARGTTFIGRAGSGVNLGVFGETCASTGILFDDCSFDGTSQGAYLGLITGDVTINDCVSGIRTLGATYGLHVGSSTNVHINGFRAQNQGAGYGLYTVGTTGTMRGIVYRNLANRIDPTAGAMGLAAPTNTGVVGDIVENQDAAPTEYLGWICTGGATWKGFGVIET
jgi:hypothetical protein